MNIRIDRRDKKFIWLFTIVCIGLFTFITFSFITSKDSYGQQGVIVLPPPDIDYKTGNQLQLRTFAYITPAPIIPLATPILTSISKSAITEAQAIQDNKNLPVCAHDTPIIQTQMCRCLDTGADLFCPVPTGKDWPNCPAGSGGVLTGLDPASLILNQCVYADLVFDASGNNITGDGYVKNLNNPSCQKVCWGKPVIYLYPVKPTKVAVKLKIPGRVTVSDPLYPGDGWKDILAFPDGKLIYQGKIYKELYYESEVDINPIPTNGIVIASNELKPKLEDILTKLGLVSNERKEFIEYWLPKLENLQSPYIFFSVLSPAQKEEVDRVEVAPKPDTEIAFLVYFKPLAKPVEVVPLILPVNPPERNGFSLD